MDITKSLIQDMLASIQDDYDVSDICICAYWTAVTSFRCGLASSMVTSLFPSEEHQVRAAGDLLPGRAKELANLSFSSHILEASIGIAAVNSIIPINESFCEDLNAGSLLRTLGKGKQVAIVGHFPFVKDLRRDARKLWIFELPGRGRPGDITGNEIKNLLPQAEIVAITSTTLINHTLGGILDLISPGAFKMMLGPSTPLSTVLFDYGFDALSGSIVIDQSQVMHCITQGANFRQVRGVRKVTIQRKAL